jgi:hypothetical protein
VAEVADQIAEECLKDVKSILSKHVADGGTRCLPADAWTKKRRQFIASVAYFDVKWRLMRAVISCKTVPMGRVNLLRLLRLLSMLRLAKREWVCYSKMFLLQQKMKMLILLLLFEVQMLLMFRAMLMYNRLRLMGARVEAVLMTNFNSQLADARQRPD